MFEYTGKHYKMHSKTHGDVNVLEYKKDGNGIWSYCEMCGKPLKRIWYTVQTADEDLVIGEYGSCCIKKLA